MSILQWRSHINRLEKGTELFTSRNIIQNRGSIATAVSILPDLPSKLDTCLPFTLIGAICVQLLAALIAKEAKCWVPATHPHLWLYKPQANEKQTCCWHIRKPWKALTKPTRKKKSGSMETVLVGCSNIAKGQVWNSPFRGTMIFVTGVFAWNIGEGISEILRYGTKAQNSRLIKIAINPLLNTWFLRSQKLSAGIW